jgi:hypothetical protein
MEDIVITDKDAELLDDSFEHKMKLVVLNDSLLNKLLYFKKLDSRPTIYRYFSDNCGMSFLECQITKSNKKTHVIYVKYNDVIYIKEPRKNNLIKNHIIVQKLNSL